MTNTQGQEIATKIEEENEESIKGRTDIDYSKVNKDEYPHKNPFQYGKKSFDTFDDLK